VLESLNLRGSSMVTRVLIVDSEGLPGSGLRRIVEADARFEVTDVVGDRRAALSSCKANPPDAVIVYCCPPIAELLQLIEDIHGEPRNVPILAIPPDDCFCPHFVTHIAKAGARGCLDRHCTEGELIRTLGRLCKGETVFNPRAAALLAEYHSIKTGKGKVATRDLSDREVEISLLLTEGRTPRQIADLLHLSVHTVLNRKKMIFKKAGVHSVLELSLWADRVGLRRAPHSSASSASSKPAAPSAPEPTDPSAPEPSGPSASEPTGPATADPAPPGNLGTTIASGDAGPSTLAEPTEPTSADAVSPDPALPSPRRPPKPSRSTTPSRN